MGPMDAQLYDLMKRLDRLLYKVGNDIWLNEWNESGNYMELMQ